MGAICGGCVKQSDTKYKQECKQNYGHKNQLQMRQLRQQKNINQVQIQNQRKAKRQASIQQRSIQNIRNQLKIVEPTQNNNIVNNNQIQIIERQPHQINQNQIMPIQQNQVINQQQIIIQRQGHQMRAQIEPQISQTISEIQRRQESRMRSEQNQNMNDNHIININMRNRRNNPNLDIQALSQNLFFIDLIRMFRSQNGNHLQNLHRLIILLQLLQHHSENEGLTQNQIQSLQRKSATNDDTACAVCQDNIKIGQQALILPCRHEFHPSCILPWFQRNYKCPLCRASVRIN